jgi:predicted MPP superfamily phosphohydrolase
MDLNHFEKRDQTKEQIIHAEALGESEANFARNEMEKIKHKLDAKKIFGTLLGIIVLLVIFAGYSQYKLRSLSLAEKNTDAGMPVITASTTPQDIINILGKHILLPEGDPQIAEVRDIEKLRDQQAFFKNAENGDIIVLYATTIFIYRPSKDIIVASGDVTGLGQTKP